MILTNVPLVGDTENGGGRACVRAEGIRKISVPPQFFCET